MSDKQDWISAERESKIFLRVIITDRIGPHLFLLQIYYKNYNFRKIVKTKAMVFIYLFLFSLPATPLGKDYCPGVSLDLILYFEIWV